MLLVDLIAGAMVTTGASLLLVGGIGLALTRSEERKNLGGVDAAATCDDKNKGDNHERENQQIGA